MEGIRQGLSALCRRLQRAALACCMVGLPIAGLGSDNLQDSNTTLVPIVVTRSTTYATAGFPFSALVSRSGAVLVSVTADGSAGSATGVQIFEPESVGGFVPVCLNALPSSLGSRADAEVLSLFPGARDAAMGIGYPGAMFYHVRDLLACDAGGYVVAQGSTRFNDAGSFAVALTPDRKFAFVANEYGIAPGAITEGNIGVVAIERDVNGDFTSGTALIGRIPTGGNAVAGVTISRDGTRLYVTSEIAASNTIASGGGNPVLSRTGCVQQVGGIPSINGLLTVIDVAAAEANPNSAAILATVAAGCSPVRMAETRDRSTLWVSARGDNRVLAFSVAALESNPDEALLGHADSGGTAPVGIRLFHHDRLLAVANSNRFDTGTANATILDVTCPASANVVQTIPTGLFPREINVGPDDATLYLTNYISKTFQVIETSTPFWDDSSAGDESANLARLGGPEVLRDENPSWGKDRHVRCRQPDLPPP